MNESTYFPALASGLMSGGAILVVALGVALLYEHGRYVPLWLPDLGMLAAYTFHAIWTAGVNPAVGAGVTLALAALLAWGIHWALIARFLPSKDFLSPLLIGLGLSQIFQGIASLYGHGMSQHYPPNFLSQQAFSALLGISVHWVDVAFFATTAACLVGLHFFLRYTHLGLQVRAVVDNPDWAKSLGLPVRSVDAIVLSVAAILVSTGTIMRGIRFDLQPSMMFYPGLGAIVACVAASPGRNLTAIAVVIAMEVVISLVGTNPAIAPLQRAVPFALLVVVFVARSLMRWRQDRQETLEAP